MSEFFSRKTIVLLITFIGILLITVAVVKDSHHCQKEKIVYRYLPRTFNQQYDHPVPVSEIFEKMFRNPSPWMSGVNTYDRKQQAEINKFFLSQV